MTPPGARVKRISRVPGVSLALNPRLMAGIPSGLNRRQISRVATPKESKAIRAVVERSDATG